MDPETMNLVGIFAGVLVSITVVLLLIVKCSMREKTYDEVLAEQRSKMQLEQAPSKQKVEKKDKKKKVKKVKSDKPVEKTEEKIPEPVPEHKMVELELEPEVIESPDQAKLKPKKSRSKSDRTILKNKEEKSFVREEADTEETFHPSHLPKDSVELKYDKERKQRLHGSDSQDSQLRERKVKKKEIPIEEVVQATTAVKQQAAPPAMESRNKKKSTEDVSANKSGDVGVTLGDRLLKSIKTASLTPQEIQGLIDALLNRQGAGAAGSDQWTKKSQKGDPAMLMKKQLEEKERDLQDEQQRSLSASNKLKDLQQELAQEKQKYARMEKQSASQISEIQALHNRMRQTHEQHRAEMNAVRVQGQMQGNFQEQNAHIQRLTEENKQLKDASIRGKGQLTIMQDELSKNALRLNASENAKKTLETKIARYEEERRERESHRDSEVVLQRRLKEVSDELRRAENKNSTLQRDLDKAKSSSQLADQELSNVRNRMKDLEHTSSSSDSEVRTLEARLRDADKQKSDMEKKVGSFEGKVSEIEKQNKQKDQELQQLKEENKKLESELKMVKERTAGEGQESPAPPSGRTYKRSEGDSTAVPGAQHDKIVLEKSQEVSTLQEKLNEQTTELEKLKEDLEAQRKKNNDLREKNWKAMEALDKAEKSSQQQIKNEEKLTKEQKQMKDTLSRLFPQVNIKNEDWPTVLEKEVKSYMQQQSSSQDVSKLEAQVQHYQKVLADTESILNKLQSSVESEEKNWIQKIRSAEQEAQQAKDNVARLSKEIETLKKQAVSPDKLAALEARLSAAENEKTQLKDSLNKELEALQQQLSEEKKGKKELASANVKLNGMLKTGQDALKAEQDLVNKLQSQIQDKSKPISNGSATNEVDVLKNKLSTTQRQLEKEIQSNRHLSQRLAVLAGNKDTGTSV